jgi:threonine aldolase
MIRFNCDYSEGAHPRVLQKLIETNLVQTPGYGEDEYCEAAAARIREMCGREDVAVHFMVGGTQANLTVLAAALRPYQGVLACDSAHIAIHESGAIEATGHKVLTLPNRGGKLAAEMIRAFCEAHFGDDTHEHMVMPGAVYISDSTEFGTIYTACELRAIRAACDEFGLILYLDGARLGFALAAEGNDVTLPLLAELCDAFYIGGTKQGLLFGEAIVIANPKLARDFRYIMKQKGGMLAKGRLLGAQFGALLEDDLYMDISRRADAQAMRIKAAALQKGYALYADSPTNQQFIVMPDEAIAKLAKDYAFAYIARVDEKNSAVRFCTGWATGDGGVDALVRDISML